MVAGVTRNRSARVVAAVVGLVVVNSAYSLLCGGLALGHLQASTRGLVEDLRSTEPANIDPLLVAGRSAQVAMETPSLAGASRLPGIGRDVSVARFAGRAAGMATHSIREAAGDLAAIAGSEQSLAGAIYADGRVDFSGTERIGEIVQSLQFDVARMTHEATQLGPASTRVMSKAQNKLMKTLTAGRTSLERAATVLRMVPSLAGGDGERRYFLAFQSPSEARGSGGLIGVYAILAADNGRIELDHIGAVQELNALLKRDVSAPDWYEDLYGRLQALEEMRHANLGLHFPTVADVLLQMYEQATGEALDGVMTFDPIVLEQMTRATGPLRGPGWDVKVGPKNARRVLLHDSYLEFGQYRSKAQNRFLTGVIDDLLGRLNGGRVDAVAMARALATSAKWQHLKIYATDPALQAELRSLGISGDPTAAEGHVQAAFHNNFTGSKVDYFLHRELHTNIEIASDGIATVTSRLRLTNEAPTSPSSLLIRPIRRRFSNGHNRMTLSFALPRGARSIRYLKSGSPRTPLRGNENGLPVVWDVVDVPAGEEIDVEVSYQIPDAISEEGTFVFTLWPQALVRPDDFTVTVSSSGGLEDVTPPRQLGSDGSYELSGGLFGPKTIEVRVAR